MFRSDIYIKVYLQNIYRRNDGRIGASLMSILGSTYNTPVLETHKYSIVKNTKAGNLSDMLFIEAEKLLNLNV